ncbi:hypothetical protein Agub_g13534, partial [Astrephomene gubernaculifera]
MLRYSLWKSCFHSADIDSETCHIGDGSCHNLQSLIGHGNTVTSRRQDRAWWRKLTLTTRKAKASHGWPPERNCACKESSRAPIRQHVEGHPVPPPQRGAPEFTAPFVPEPLGPTSAGHLSGADDDHAYQQQQQQHASVQEELLNELLQLETNMFTTLDTGTCTGCLDPDMGPLQPPLQRQELSAVVPASDSDLLSGDFLVIDAESWADELCGTAIPATISTAHESTFIVDQWAVMKQLRLSA